MYGEDLLASGLETRIQPTWFLCAVNPGRFAPIDCANSVCTFYRVKSHRIAVFFPPVLAPDSDYDDRRRAVRKSAETKVSRVSDKIIISERARERVSYRPVFILRFCR